MPTIAEVRQKFPDYNDMSDTELASALHKKFYSDMPEAEFNAKIGLTAGPAPAAPVRDDHGLARRQAMTPIEKAASPITEYPRHQRELAEEGVNQFFRGAGQLGEGFRTGLTNEPGSLAGLSTAAKGAANAGMGALGYTFSPLSALYRSVIGQPIEDVTGIPREQTEFTAQLLTPGLGFTRLPRAPGVAPPAPLIRPVDVERPAVAEAAQRLQDYAGVQTPRTITGGPTAQATGQYLSNAPYAGQPIAEAVKTTLPQQLEQARNIAAAEYGAGTGANVGERVGGVLKEQAAAEAKTAEQVAATANAEAAANWERVNQEKLLATAAREKQSTDTAQQAVGPDLHPQDMGAFNINRTRLAHDAAETRKNALYDEASNIDARISDNANIGLHGYVERTLERKNIHPDDVEAEGAARTMLNRIENFSNTARAREDLAPVGASMQEVEQLRQNLNFIYGRATNDADKRAARHIIDALDDWQATATRDHLMPGSDPSAHQAFIDARAANRDWRTKFGYNKRDDADKLINKIVTGAEDQHTGEVGVSEALTRGGDQSALFHRRLTEATGSDPEVAQSIRSGTWNKLTRDAEGNSLPPEKVQANVREYLHGKGRATAERVFTQQQRDLMHAHAETVVDTAAQRKAIEAEAKATKPKEIKAEPGAMQQLADQVIGGKTSGEALFGTLHGYAKKGGDVRTLSRVINQLPTELRGDVAGAFVRELGIAPGTKQFSLDHFANQWADMTPQAKAVLLGNAGPHVTALNDIATVARRLKEVKGKYGNPSGTAQNTLFGLLVSAAATAPYAPKTAATAVGAAAGGRIIANALAKPAGASSIRKYVEAVERAERLQSPTHLAAVKATQRNMVNTIRTFGGIKGPGE